MFIPKSNQAVKRDNLSRNFIYFLFKDATFSVPFPFQFIMWLFSLSKTNYSCIEQLLT